MWQCATPRASRRQRPPASIAPAHSPVLRFSTIFRQPSQRGGGSNRRTRWRPPISGSISWRPGIAMWGCRTAFIHLSSPGSIPRENHSSCGRLGASRLGQLGIVGFFGGKHANFNIGLWRREFAAATTKATLRDIFGRLRRDDQPVDLDHAAPATAGLGWHRQSLRAAAAPDFR